jgi:hypothetical protein
MDEETKKDNILDEEVPDEDIKEIMEAHDLDKDEAEQVQELMDELGVDEDEAVEIMQEL